MPPALVLMKFVYVITFSYPFAHAYGCLMYSYFALDYFEPKVTYLPLLASETWKVGVL